MNADEFQFLQYHLSILQVAASKPNQKCTSTGQLAELGTHEQHFQASLSTVKSTIQSWTNRPWHTLIEIWDLVNGLGEPNEIPKDSYKEKVERLKKAIEYFKNTVAPYAKGLNLQLRGGSRTFPLMTMMVELFLGPKCDWNYPTPQQSQVGDKGEEVKIMQHNFSVVDPDVSPDEYGRSVYGDRWPTAEEGGKDVGGEEDID
ncbi:uncharacterized protein PV07_10039 [Cladophialophora immunda]|uniref:Uncharacterized protein n=1 Tax=Cladophialophora immunda TaxID=569365 RepID=A0A0D2AHE0_9EURO|nr:uncharacterized protein PV07_10039 [Cladophialophora immunda]KIW24312.1 hypothetical protein PV07_10039 [Cladophialophora immunda]OQU97862.1 hypothetical protein CLAIMM_03739 [Cladophialophora immunda]